MNEFVTWSILIGYATFVSVVFLFVNFTKELKYIKNIPTKYYSFFVSFIFMVIVNIYNGSFKLWDLFIYMLSSIVISLNANGIADFNKIDNKVISGGEIKDE